MNFEAKLKQEQREKEQLKITKEQLRYQGTEVDFCNLITDRRKVRSQLCNIQCTFAPRFNFIQTSRQSYWLNSLKFMKIDLQVV